MTYEDDFNNFLDKLTSMIFELTEHHSQSFWQIVNSVLNKGKSAIPPLFNGPEVLSSASDKAKLGDENLSKTAILMTQVSLYLFSFLELI